MLQSQFVMLCDEYLLQEFLARVKSSGPPKLLAKAKYKQLYKSFVQSCHFWPWFKAKEQVRRVLGWMSLM